MVRKNVTTISLHDSDRKWLHTLRTTMDSEEVSKQNEGLFPKREWIENPDLAEGGYYGVRWLSAGDALDELVNLSDEERELTRIVAEANGGEGSILDGRKKFFEGRQAAFTTDENHYNADKGVDTYDREARTGVFMPAVYDNLAAEMDEIITGGDMPFADHIGKLLAHVAGGGNAEVLEKYKIDPELTFQPWNNIVGREPGDEFALPRAKPSAIDVGLEYIWAQGVFKERYGDSVRLYRGITNPESVKSIRDAHDGEEAIVLSASDDKTMSYWTSDPRIAESFARGEFTGQGTQGGVVVTTDMPTRLLFASPLTTPIFSINMQEVEDEHLVLNFEDISVDVDAIVSHDGNDAYEYTDPADAKPKSEGGKYIFPNRGDVYIHPARLDEDGNLLPGYGPDGWVGFPEEEEKDD